ncbi:MAG: beta-ketoacyl synthase [Desulfobacterales bacterium CG07_land_8_20_14_0_80_52_14]|nr:MAG: beta-ketoacyl synthase [Desulfobacterales bacterium CG23_combo_of_CG06-09_8_20_14_all_52_9]PIU49165.1 MAG: beta-ketoacyl synthase [Desulfobacterales bacterium CG07_land_8_20_14_0_80_52_14]
MRISLLGIGWATASTLGTGKDAGAFSLAPGHFTEAVTNIRLDPPYPRFGRMDDVSKAALAAVVLAMKDAGLEKWDCKRAIGIIAATRTGCLKTDMDYFQDILSHGGGSASPHHFAYTLPSTFIGDASIYLGITGPGFVVQEKNTLSLTGLGLALDTICRGEAAHMVAGAYDAGIPEPLGFGEDSKPYAVFLVIGKAVPGRMGYGEIETAHRGTVRFRGKPIYNLLDILRADPFLSKKDSSNRKGIDPCRPGSL